MSKKISFNKSDMTYITDDDLATINIALGRYHRDMITRKIDYNNTILNLQMQSSERMIKLFEDQAGFLIVPYFPIDETI